MLWDIQQQDYVITAICISLALAFAVPMVAAAGSDSDHTASKPIETQVISCEKCHNEEVEKSRIGVNTDLCASCHEGAHNAREGQSPSRYSGVDIHGSSIHTYHSGTNGQPGCKDCHIQPACNSCHSGHPIQDNNISKNCQLCHGQLPDPNGHKEQRSTFRKSMHGWMGSCSTCHIREKLHFKDLGVFELNESSQLCYVCHSKQYKDDKHSGGIATSQKCIDCHNPHGEPSKIFEIKLPNGEEFASTIKDLIFHNAVAIILILLLGVSSIAEYAFTPKEGKIVLAKALRVEHEKAQTKAIKVTIEESAASNSYVLGKIGNILDKPGVTLLGMVTSTKDIILFVAGAHEGLIEELQTIDGVRSAEYSDEYEV